MTALIAAIFILPTGALADPYNPALGWQTRQPSLLCDSYFKVKDGEKAALGNDQKWLAETGCIIAPGGLRLVLLDTSEHAQAWRARIYGLLGDGGRDVYLRSVDAVAFADAGTHKSEKEAQAVLAEMKRRFKRHRDRDSDMSYRIAPFGPDKVKLWVGPSTHYNLHSFCEDAREDRETSTEWGARSKRESDAYLHALRNWQPGQPTPTQKVPTGPAKRGASLVCDTPTTE